MYCHLDRNNGADDFQTNVVGREEQFSSNDKNTSSPIYTKKKEKRLGLSICNPIRKTMKLRNFIFSRDQQPMAALETPGGALWMS